MESDRPFPTLSLSVVPVVVGTRESSVFFLLGVLVTVSRGIEL